jgi:hypothetical protein
LQSYVKFINYADERKKGRGDAPGLSLDLPPLSTGNTEGTEIHRGIRTEDEELKAISS